jgi:hypothetical protein
VVKHLFPCTVYYTSFSKLPACCSLSLGQKCGEKEKKKHDKCRHRRRCLHGDGDEAEAKKKITDAI